MKKIYMNPTMKVVVIKHRQQLLGASTPDASIKRDGSVNAGLVEASGFDDFDDFDE